MIGWEHGLRGIIARPTSEDVGRVTGKMPVPHLMPVPHVWFGLFQNADKAFSTR